VIDALTTRLDLLDSFGGDVSDDGSWAWAFPLSSLGGHLGYLVVEAAVEPPDQERFLLRVLAQEAGVALSHARSFGRQAEDARSLAITNALLSKTVNTLEQSAAIHGRLLTVATHGAGLDGIARALLELTARPVAIEDRFGNLVAWAGAGVPETHQKLSPREHADLIARLQAAGKPLPQGNWLTALVPALDDPFTVAIANASDDEELAVIAIAAGATVLAVEIAKTRSIAETELRLRRDLVEDLLAGTDDASAMARARALDYDLGRPHRVVVVDHTPVGADWSTTRSEAAFRAVRRAAQSAGVGTLLVSRGDTVVLLAFGQPAWDAMATGISADVGVECRIGVGGLSARPSELPRSFAQANVALRVREAARATTGTASFDDLGVYKLFAEVGNLDEVTDFIADWLGTLIEYDQGHRGAMLETLTRYLREGANLGATAAGLIIHRSTLRYRVARIEAISGRDLRDPDVRFNFELALRARETLSALAE
jgi:sugar diacid utilization regulator